MSDDGGLDAEVEGDNASTTTGRSHGGRRVARHRRHQIEAVGARFDVRCLCERGQVRRSEGARHGARVAQVAGEAPGVDSGDARHAMGPK